MKRTRRNGSGEKQEKEKENEQPIQADRPCHKVRDSLLSSKSGFHNYRGLLNDCIICLVLSSSHIILRNFDKYGLLIDPREWFYVMIQVINYSSAVLLALIWLFPALTFIMEVLASKFLIKEKVLFVFHTVNLFIFIITPVVVAFVSEPSPAGTFIVMLNYAIVWMKMVSYCHVNKWCRLSNNTTSNSTSNSTTGNGNSTVATGNSSNTSTGSKSAIVTYPNNLNVKDFIYFLFAPTLCYELNFPSSPSIRKMFLIRRTLEAVGGSRDMSCDHHVMIL
jgi:diacylglycerol O-acyltransferase-1